MELSHWWDGVPWYNAQTFYEDADGMGWSDTKKRRQLLETVARFLVVTGSVRLRHRDYLEADAWS